MAYVFDTSALIGAWVRSYPPDVMPGLWENLDNLAQRGEMHAPEEVFAELKRQDDDLTAWVKERSDQIVVATTRALMLEARDILLDHAGLTMTGTGRGLADPFVIALAALKECPVVTHEQGGSAAKPRIPYVCGQRQVGCMNMLGVIRAERWQFH